MHKSPKVYKNANTKMAVKYTELTVFPNVIQPNYSTAQLQWSQIGIFMWCRTIVLTPTTSLNPT